MMMEFLEIAIHEILSKREVYPKEVFEHRKRYGLKVDMSRHPELNEYIFGVLDGARDWIKKDKVHSVAVHILGPQRHLLERFVFDMGITSALAAAQFNRDQLNL